MKTLYLECKMGAAGDMLAAALLELHPDPGRFLKELNCLKIPGISVARFPLVQCGIAGTKFSVTVNGREEEQGSHHHIGENLSLRSIEPLLEDLPVSGKVKRDVLAVYCLIAEAESRVHGVPVERVHFHELGMLDAFADILTVCLLLEALAPEQILASPVNVGGGTVRCAHGVLPVPAPATALLLEGIPVYGSDGNGELCTPTGAALLRHFSAGFGQMPQLRVRKIGYGMGSKELETANCVRAFLGETDDASDEILELCCNLDDMTPEAVGFSTELLLKNGALDVFTTPIGMKKNRPAVLLTCLCKKDQREEMVQLLFRHTTTLGVRESVCRRYTLRRQAETLETAYGPVRIKRSSGWDITREKMEYDDLARIAREQGVSLAEATKLAEETAKQK